MTDYAIEGLREARAPRVAAAPAPRTRPHKLGVPFDVHRAIVAGRTPGRLDAVKPAWTAGQAVQVSTALAVDDRRVEEPVTLTVVAVSPVMVCDLTADHARAVGLRLATDVQRLALDLPPETPAAVVNMRAHRNQTTVWITAWTRVEHDSVRILRNAGWKAPEGPLQWRPIDAGEQVSAEYQRHLCGLAQPDIDARTERAAKVNAKRLRVSKAKRAVVHREATRRRRIEVARTDNSSVAEHVHGWVPTGAVLTADPPLYEVRCECGETRQVRNPFPHWKPRVLMGPGTHVDLGAPRLWINPKDAA